MKIESDRVEVSGGVRFGRTTGSPVSLRIVNRDHENWLESMSVDGPAPKAAQARGVTRPRPGHADLAGALKFGTHDAREILERASARETAARVAAGGLARALLEPLGIEVTSRTLAVGKVGSNVNYWLELAVAVSLSIGLLVAWRPRTGQGSLRTLLVFALALQAAWEIAATPGASMRR